MPTQHMSHPGVQRPLSTPTANQPATTPTVHQLASESLLQGQRCVEITHNGNVYRLSATRMGKLILTK